MNYNCSNLLDIRNLQEQVKKAFCYQKSFWPFTVWINCSNDLKNFANPWPSASNFKSFSRSVEQFFLTVGQNKFGNKIPIYSNYNITFLLFQKVLVWTRKILNTRLGAMMVVGKKKKENANYLFCLVYKIYLKLD